MTRVLALSLALCAPAACSGKRSFEAPVLLGGRSVPAGVLNRGELVYMRACRGCHGQRGRGDGPYASTACVRPRDLTAGRYPRTAPQGGLPSDEALHRIVREGIEGTPMRPQRLSDPDREAVVQYVKTLAPIWRAPPQLVQ